MNAASQNDPLRDARRRMVDEQVAARGVRDPRVLQALRDVPRHAFVPDCLRDAAYEDGALPIGHGQTISQPYVVAFLAESARLRPTDRVLEVGAGSGYAAAVMSRLAHSVDAVERIPELAAAARERLDRLGYANVRVHDAGAELGLPEAAPYDAIVVSACSTSIATALTQQLADGGRMILPVGPRDANQTLYRVTRDGDSYRREDLGRFAFVPLIEDAGEA